MNTYATADPTPIGSFYRRGMEEAGKPGQRHRTCAAVVEFNHEIVIVKPRVLGSLLL
jgi:hypothetical protein